jgi:prepilin-type N-terminal cleavage/methylation domain-containing protein
MLHPTRSSRAFTLIEMLVVMAVIAILAGIILSINGLVQKKAATTKAQGEIQAMSVGLEKYKTDFGSYPQSPEQAAVTGPNSPNNFTGATNKLDPRLVGDPNDAMYKAASLTLYRALSGDMDCNMRLEDMDCKTNIDGTLVSPVPTTLTKPTNYLPDFFIPGRLGVSATSKVLFLKDPFGNSYGYSTKAGLIDQKYQAALALDANAVRPTGTNAGGYNTTFDLWSTAGKSTFAKENIGKSNDDTNVWIKNW